MSTHRLNRSTPFWVLVGGSAVATAGGAYLLITKLASMDAGLTSNTATTSDVYVGQIWAVAGAILTGIGLIGFALALTVGALASLAPAQADVVESPVWEEDVVVAADPAVVEAAESAKTADTVESVDIVEAAPVTESETPRA